MENDLVRLNFNSLDGFLSHPCSKGIFSHACFIDEAGCTPFLGPHIALGRHKLRAAAANLVEGEKPADVYSGIAARVIEIMRRDAEGDTLTDQNAKHTRLLVDEVDRKLIKQTVMTSVYGVTYIGARDQIKRSL